MPESDTALDRAVSEILAGIEDVVPSWHEDQDGLRSILTTLLAEAERDRASANPSTKRLRELALLSGDQSVLLHREELLALLDWSDRLGEIERLATKIIAIEDAPSNIEGGRAFKVRKVEEALLYACRRLAEETAR